jgi:hypothetical protein
MRVSSHLVLPSPQDKRCHHSLSSGYPLLGEQGHLGISFCFENGVNVDELVCELLGQDKVHERLVHRYISAVPS